jgi:hypothetical protein
VVGVGWPLPSTGCVLTAGWDCSCRSMPHFMHDACHAHTFPLRDLLRVSALPIASYGDQVRLGSSQAQIGGGLVVVLPGFSNVARVNSEP